MTKTLRGMVGATIFPDGGTYIFKLRESETPDAHRRAQIRAFGHFRL